MSMWAIIFPECPVSFEGTLLYDIVEDLQVGY